MTASTSSPSDPAMELAQKLAGLEIASLPKGPTTFPQFQHLPQELRLKIWRYGAKTARQDKLHLQWSCCMAWGATGGYPSAIAANFEAQEEAGIVYRHPLPEWGFKCVCDVKGYDNSWLDRKIGTLYSPQALEWTRVDRGWASIGVTGPCTIKMMTARSIRHYLEFAKRLVIEFTTEFIADCVSKDEYFKVLMTPEKATKYLVGTEAAEARQTGNWSEVTLAAGNLKGIEQLANLEELVVIFQPGEFWHLGWDKETAMLHVLLRLDLVRLEHPEWKNPKLRFINRIAEL